MPSRKKRAQAKARKAARAIAKAKREEEELQRNEEEFDSDPMTTHGTGIHPEEQYHHNNLIEHEEEKEVEENFEGVGTKATEATKAGQQQPHALLDTTAIVGPSTLTNVREPCNHGNTVRIKDRSNRLTHRHIFTYVNVLEAVINKKEIYEEIYYKAGDMMESYILDTVVPWMKNIISYFIWEGTEELILNGATSKHAVKAAFYINYFEHALKAFFLTKPGILHRSGFIAPGIVDAHTLVRFFQKRIPCTCLDTKYEEVRSITKMSVCHNPSCNLPHRRAARSDMFYCAQCKQANYCSRECQKSDWKRHKCWCNTVTASLDAADYNDNKMYLVRTCERILMQKCPLFLEEDGSLTFEYEY